MKKSTRGTEDSAKRIVHKRFLEAAVRNGIVDPNGKSDAEIQQEFSRWVESWPEDVDLRMIVDHRSTLLASARQAIRKGHINIASVMYAVWTEHWINSQIDARATALGLDQAETKEIIRTVQIAGKTSWLLFLLELPGIAPRHAAQIRRLFEARNCFVHYKWTALPHEEEKKSEEGLRALVLSYRKTVDYLQDYENQHVMKKTKRRLHRIARTAGAPAVQHGVAPVDRPRTAARR